MDDREHRLLTDMGWHRRVHANRTLAERHPWAVLLMGPLGWTLALVAFFVWANHPTFDWSTVLRIGAWAAAILTVVAVLAWIVRKTFGNPYR